jgi:hypothetical protein
MKSLFPFFPFNVLLIQSAATLKMPVASNVIVMYASDKKVIRALYGFTPSVPLIEINMGRRQKSGTHVRDSV